MDGARYKKGGDAGSKGVGFQVSLLVIFLLNALQTLQRHTNWRLSTENERAGKFDDVVLEWSTGTILLQAKHKKKKKITLEDLLSTNLKNNDFSLPKYFLSYQEIKNEFKGNTSVIICTNAVVHEKTMEFLDSQRIGPESVLYCLDDDYLFYTVNRKILPLLKQNIQIYLEINCQNNKCIDQTVITDENLKDFLERLRIYASYPSEHDLEGVVEQQLSFMKRSSDLYENISSIEVRAKVMDWFQRKEGIYLTEARAKAMFCELRTDKYWQTLEQYRVIFLHNDLQFSDSKRICYVITENGYLLQVIKIADALKNYKAKILFVNPCDSVEVQKQMVEAFQLPQYTFLVIIWPESTEESVMTDISDTLCSALISYQFKKIILITESGYRLNQVFGLNQSDFEVNLRSGSFDDLSDETRERLLNKKNIIFQGQEISLRKLFIKHDCEDFEKAANLLLPSLIYDEKVTLGALLDLNENFSRFYINRTFKRETDKMRDQEVNVFYSENNIYDVNEKIILIADAAGMGKTTVLKNLTALIKERHPHLWVIKIELNDSIAVLKDFSKSNRKTINVLDLLNSRSFTKLTNKFDNFVFALDKNVVLMLDGVDEVSPDYTDLIVSLLVHCQEASNFAKVFVTTRPHVVQEFKANLQVASFTLEPFTKEDQIYFLTRYWTHHLNLRDNFDERKCKRYAEALIHKMLLSDLNKDIEDHFAAIPLQLRMLAEIFQESMVSDELLDWEGCKEYIRRDKGEPKLSEEMNLVKLYNMFIDKKRRIFIDKENPNGHIAATQALNDQFEESLSYHRKLAIDIVFVERAYDLFTCYKTSKNMETVALKIGIVHKSQDDDYEEFHFIHRTLAEYFVAESIIRELQCQNQNYLFQKLIIDEVFYTRRSNVILTFLDKFLKEIVDSIPSTVFQNYQSLSDESRSWEHNFDLIHRLAEKGFVAVLQLILKCIHVRVIRDKEVNIFKFYNWKIRNTLTCLQFFLERDGLNIKDNLDRTPLHFAASKGHLKMVTFLVKQGANIDSKSYWCNIPIVEAVQNCHVNVTRYLLEQALEMNVVDETARVSDCDMTAFLLEINSRNSIEKMMVPYVTACMGCLTALEVSIERGVDINGRFGNGETLIFGAARGGQLHIIEYLVQKGGNINTKNDCGRTALHLISETSRGVPTAKLLIELGIDIDATDNSGSTALHLAISAEIMDMVRLLILYGANVNSKDVFGKTAMILAASWSVLDCVKLLLKNGGKVNERDMNGNTTIHLAAKQGRLDVVQFFIECGVDVNIRNDYGQTALHAAAFGADEDIVQCLVQHGLDVNTTDDIGRTALYVAVERFASNITTNVARNEGYIIGYLMFQRAVSCFKFFLDRGADVNIKVKSGSSMLHLAVEGEQTGIVKFLIEVGADVTAKDGKGRTPLHRAAKEGRTAMVQLLIEHGAHVNCRDRKGKKSAALAKKAGHMHIYHYLKTSNERLRCIRILGAGCLK